MTPFSTALTKAFLLCSNQSSQAGQTPNTIQRKIAPANRAERRPSLTSGEAWLRLRRRQTHAVNRRRCSFILGALWNLPSFMIASSRVLSCRMRMFGDRIAVDQQHVGEIALLDHAEFVAHSA